MDAIDDLTARLAKISTDAMAVLDLRAAGLNGLPDEIAHRLGRSASAGRGELPKKPSSERIELSIAAVRSGAALEFRDIRYAGYGSCTRTGAGYCLLGDPAGLSHLLAAVSAEAGSRPFRRLYAPLLNSYFTADRYADNFDAQMSAGLETVRKFLEAHLHRAIAAEPRTSWAEALNTRPELLSQNPGSAFAQDWIKGDAKAFTSTLEQMRIVGTSWLAGDVVRSALGLAVGGDDVAFTGQIDALLSAAGEKRFLGLRDEIYAGLLTRYAACRGARPHDRLRDAVIGAWQAPWLLKNQAAWGRVSDATRKMVEGWLKLELIHQFFDVLSDDKQQDRRRFEFWRGFHEQMDTVYFALSPDAHRSRDTDRIKLKKALDGRLLQYVGGTPNTHAFIMYIGERAIVEFSTKGNAAYFYDREDLAIETDQCEAPNGWLKRKSVGRPMRHDDQATSTWEDKFELEIGRSWQGSHMQANAARRPNLISVGLPSEQRVSMLELKAFADMFQIVVDDQRPLGGRLYVRTSDQIAEVNQQLGRWGFRFAPDRGWWRAD